MRTVHRGDLNPWIYTGPRTQLPGTPFLKAWTSTLKPPTGNQTFGWTFFELRGDAVVIVPRTPEGNLVLTDQYKPGIGMTSLQFPGGILKPDQNHEEVARERLKSEVGIEFSQLIDTDIGLTVQDSQSPTRVWIFIATECVFDPKAQFNEHISVFEYAISEVWDLVRTEQLVEPYTLSAFLYAVALGYIPFVPPSS